MSQVAPSRPSTKDLHRSEILSGAALSNSAQPTLNPHVTRVADSQAIYFIQSAQVFAMRTFAPGYLDFLLETGRNGIVADFGFPPGQCMDETFPMSPTLLAESHPPR